MTHPPDSPNAAPGAAAGAAPGSVAPPGSDDTLARLATLLEQRKGADPQYSYVAKLYSKGPDSILKKIGEEATETVMAAKDGDPARIVSETADLWFHCLVMLSYYDLTPEHVLAELRRREGLSGLDEKALRKLRDREADNQKP